MYSFTDLYVDSIEISGVALLGEGGSVDMLRKVRATKRAIFPFKGMFSAIEASSGKRCNRSHRMMRTSDRARKILHKLLLPVPENMVI